MSDLYKRVGELARSRRLNWSLDDRGVLVRFGDTGRSQLVRFRTRDSMAIFEARILTSHQVTKSTRYWRDLARRAWYRNARRNLVTIGFDARNRMIGRIEQSIATLDDEEIVLAVSALARECDRLELLLTGADRE